jgi:hypothetical protein
MQRVSVGLHKALRLKSFECSSVLRFGSGGLWMWACGAETLTAALIDTGFEVTGIDNQVTLWNSRRRREYSF